MLVANLAQALQITFGRQVPARAARYWLNNHRSNVARVVQRQNAVFKLQQNVFFPLRLRAVNIGMVHRIMNEPHVVNTWQQRRAVRLAVSRNAAHAHAAKTYAVVAALSANKHIAVAFAARAVVSQSNFHRGVGCF